jgi:hypothetical protein
MADGVVVVAGIFPPGSVVVLTKMEGDYVLRPEGGEEVARRLVDDNGNVGFDSLEVGERYFASGYVGGYPVDVRCHGVDAEAPDHELAQAPVQPETPKIGTQEAVVPPVPPEAPDEALEVGVAAAAEAALPPPPPPPEPAPAAGEAPAQTEQTPPEQPPAEGQPGPEAAEPAASAAEPAAAEAPAEAPAEAAPAEAPPAESPPAS